jgi:hypothetical protein
MRGGRWVSRKPRREDGSWFRGRGCKGYFEGDCVIAVTLRCATDYERREVYGKA